MGRLLAEPVNIRLGWRFIVQAPGVLFTTLYFLRNSLMGPIS